MNLKNLLSILGVLLCVHASAQDTAYVWYNALNKRAPESEALYMRKIWRTPKRLYGAAEYNKQGYPELTGVYKDSSFKNKHGHFVYYEDGIKVSEGEYVNNAKEGVWNHWYIDGTTAGIRNFKRGKLHGYAADYHCNGKMAEEESYKKGDLVNAKYWDEQGNVISKEDNDYADALQRPYYPQDSIAGLHKFLGESLVYPEKARKLNKEGRVVVNFSVEKDGSVTNMRIYKSVHPLLDAEAIRVLSTMPNWKVHKQSPCHKRIWFSQPVMFTLE